MRTDINAVKMIYNLSSFLVRSLS